MSWVPYGATGFKIRLAAAAGAALFAAWVVFGAAVARLWADGPLYGWGVIAVTAAGLFYRTRRTDDEGKVDPYYLHLLVPAYLWIPLIIWALMAQDDEPPSFGHWSVFGDYWTGSGLYALFLAAVFVYNLLRLNLQRTFAPPRR
ncbi:MAG: hypothetical protein SF051_16070 [Elusimicrobiota bacterium]|nr:hypothetical protein [Elusimicrobiota bacterium]